MIIKPSLTTLDEIRAEKARRSLREYIKQMWVTTEPGEYSHNWHIDAVAEHLEAVTRGEIKRLLINMPPRHMKSLSVSVFWPTWEWLDLPRVRYMFASYTSELSTRDNVKSRDIINSPEYQKLLHTLYPNPEDRWALKGDQNVKMRYENSRGGHRIATSVSANATGDGGDRIVVDDPHSVQDAASDIKREGALIWWDRTMSSRLNDRKTGVKIIVMQRLHHKDLSGHVLEEGGYVHLCLPMEYHPKVQIEGGIPSKINVEPNPTGWEDPREVEGEILWKDRFGPSDVKELQVGLGSYGYAGQYQQIPTPEGGGMFQRNWWKYYTFMPTAFHELIMSWDLAFKQTDNSSYVVGQVWGRIGADCYLLDQVRDRMDFPTTIAAIRNFSAKWPRVGVKLVEDKANGPAVISTLKKEIPGILAVTPDGTKEARGAAVSPFVEAGNVYLPDPIKFKQCHWVNDFVEECAAFPLGENDDQVDTMSQALHRLINRQRIQVYTYDQLQAAEEGH